MTFSVRISHQKLWYYNLKIRLRGHSERLTEISMHLTEWNPGACFREVPKLIGPISGATIRFISWQCRGSKPPNFASLLVFLTLKTWLVERSAFQSKWISVWQLVFYARNVIGTFEKQAPGHISKGVIWPTTEVWIEEGVWCMKTKKK